MGSTASVSIGLTTGMLLIYVVVSSLGVPFGWVFLLFTVSAGLLIWMVVSILKDKSNPVSKKFDDQFYLDKEK